MRLIDADELKESFLSESKRLNCERWDISAILDVMQDAPTITPESLLRGKMDGETDVTR